MPSTKSYPYLVVTRISDGTNRDVSSDETYAVTGTNAYRAANKARAERASEDGVPVKEVLVLDVTRDKTAYKTE